MAAVFQYHVGLQAGFSRMFCLLALSAVLPIPWTIGKEATLNGMRLKMAAENWDPLFVIPQKQEMNAYSGVMSKVLDYLQSNLNFSTTVVRPPDGSWGVIDEETGEWGGMVGMVLRNETDFGLGKFQGTCNILGRAGRLLVEWVLYTFFLEFHLLA